MAPNFEGVNMHTKNTLSLADAKRIAAAAEAEAKSNNWNVVICVLDDGGHLIYLQRADGTQLGSIEVAFAKGRGAILFKRPTKNFEEPGSAYAHRRKISNPTPHFKRFDWRAVYR